MITHVLLNIKKKILFPIKKKTFTGVTCSKPFFCSFRIFFKALLRLRRIRSGLKPTWKIHCYVTRVLDIILLNIIAQNSNNCKWDGLGLGHVIKILVIKFKNCSKDVGDDIVSDSGLLRLCAVIDMQKPLCRPGFVINYPSVDLNSI